MHDELIQLGEGIGVDERLDALAGRPFAARVLPVDRVLPRRCLRQRALLREFLVFFFVGSHEEAAYSIAMA